MNASLVAGRAVFNPLTLSLSNTPLSPAIFEYFESKTAFREVDILGYSNNTLVSDTSFGGVTGSEITTNNTGVTQYTLGYTSVELQQSIINTNGSLTQLPSVAWNSITNTNSFRTNNGSTAPASAPATLPVILYSAVTPLTNYYIRFIESDNTILTINTNQLFKLDNFALDTVVSVAGFNSLTFTLGDPSLDPTLLEFLARGSSFAEVDILGFDSNTMTLLSDTSLGHVVGSRLSLNFAGVSQYTVEYGSIEFQQKIYDTDRRLTTIPSQAWDSVTNTNDFRTGNGITTPAIAPALDTSLVSSFAPTLNYFVRFIEVTGNVLTYASPTLYPLYNYSFDVSTALNSNLNAGKAAFNPLTLSLANAPLNPALLNYLESNVAFKEIDILGYNNNTLFSDTSFGGVTGRELTIDNTGVTQYTVGYTSVELQKSVVSASGNLTAVPAEAWNSVTNTNNFRANGQVATPASAPATLNSSMYATATASLNYFVRFIASDNTFLSVGNTHLFELLSFSADAGSTSSGPLVLTLDDASLDPALLTALARGSHFAEVDILGYDSTNKILLSDTSFGGVAGTGISISDTGQTQYTLRYASIELQDDFVSPRGVVTPVTPHAWDYVTNASDFNTGHGATTPADAATDVPCYVTGTRIATSTGDIAVEDLAIGDFVPTLYAGLQKVKWIGTRSYNGRMIAGNKAALPICIKADAIADNTPSRDLWVSPGHAICIDGVLIHASRLVNGVSIIQPSQVFSVTYYHIELDSHEVIFAENCPAETFIGEHFRQQFHNAADYAELFPMDTEANTACLPQLVSGFQLHAIQRRLSMRAGIAPTNLTGALRGYVDQAGPETCFGWAQDIASPVEPVCLDVVCEDRIVGRVLANMYRADVQAAGYGDGYCGFEFVLPAGVGGRIKVRRSSDRAELATAGDIEVSEALAA